MDSIWTSVDDLTFAPTNDQIATSRRDVLSQQPHEVEIELNVISKKYLSRYRSSSTQHELAGGSRTTTTIPAVEQRAGRLRNRVIESRKFTELGAGMIGASGSTRSNSPSGDSGLDQTPHRTSRSRSFGASTQSLNSAGGFSSTGNVWNDSVTPSEIDSLAGMTAADELGWDGATPFVTGSTRWWWPRRRAFNLWWPSYSQLRPFRRFTGGFSAAAFGEPRPLRRRSEGGFSGAGSASTAAAADVPRREKHPISPTAKDERPVLSPTVSSSDSVTSTTMLNDFRLSGQPRQQMAADSVTASHTSAPPKSLRRATAPVSVETAPTPRQQPTGRFSLLPETVQFLSTGGLAKHPIHQRLSTASAGDRSMPSTSPTASAVPSKVTVMKCSKPTSPNACSDSDGSSSLHVQVIHGGSATVSSSGKRPTECGTNVIDLPMTTTSRQPEDCLVMVVGNNELDTEVVHDGRRQSTSSTSWSTGGSPPSLQITFDQSGSTLSLNTIPSTPSSPLPSTAGAAAATLAAPGHRTGKSHRRTASQGGSFPLQLEVTFSPNM